MTNYRMLYNNRTGCFEINKNNTTKKKNVEPKPIIDANIDIADIESVPEYFGTRCISLEKGGGVGYCSRPPMSAPRNPESNENFCPKGYCDTSKLCVVNCCKKTVDNTNYCIYY